MMPIAGMTGIVAIGTIPRGTSTGGAAAMAIAEATGPANRPIAGVLHQADGCPLLSLENWPRLIL